MARYNESPQSRVERLERELEQARIDLETAKALPPEEALAEALHSSMCNWNHTDGCSWFYEITRDGVNWSGYAHAKYLEKARAGLKVTGGDAEMVVQVLQAANEV